MYIHYNIIRIKNINLTKYKIEKYDKNMSFLKNVESLWLCVFMMGFKGASLFPSSNTAT